MEFKKHSDRFIVHQIVHFVIWGVLFFVIFFDVIIEIYHNICFRLLKIPLVKRNKYIQIWDRTELEYLSFVDKIGCAYCGYVNGLAHYWVVIGAETEKYWCGIKHKKSKPYQEDYLEYGDQKAYEKLGSPPRLRNIFRMRNSKY